MEIGIDEPGGAAVDVFEAFPDDGRLVKEDVVGDERVQGGVLKCWLGVRGVGGAIIGAVDVSVDVSLGRGDVTLGINVGIDISVCAGSWDRVRRGRVLN